MSKFNIMLPLKSEVQFDVTDERLYTYELDDTLVQQIQETAANQLGLKIKDALLGHSVDAGIMMYEVTNRQTEYVAKFSEIAQRKLATGEWRLGVRKNSKETFGTLYDAVTGKATEHVNLETKTIDKLGTLPELAAIQGQLRAISKQITMLNAVVQRVEQGQYNDRFAGVFSQRQLIIEGLVTTSPELQRQLLVNAVQVGAETTAKIMLSLRADAQRLVDENTKKKDVIALENLFRQALGYLNTTVRLNLAAYTALGEEGALLATMSNYRSFMKQTLLTTAVPDQHSVAWLIDNGHHGDDGHVLELTQDIYQQATVMIGDIREQSIGEEHHERISSEQRMLDAKVPQGD